MVREKTAPTKSPSKPNTRVMQCRSQPKAANLWSIKIQEDHAYIFQNKARLASYGKTYSAVRNVSVFEHKATNSTIQTVDVCLFSCSYSYFYLFLVTVEGVHADRQAPK